MKFNTKDAPPPTDDFSPIPDGEYEICVTKAEVKPAKSGKGENLSLMMQVLEGKYKNRTWFENLCVIHDNQEAQRIALGKLSSLCLAIGIEEFEDESELLDRPFKAFVTTRKGTGGYEDSNQIKKYISNKPKNTKVDKTSFKEKLGLTEEKELTLEEDEISFS